MELKPKLSICIASMGRRVELHSQVGRLLADSSGLAVEVVVADASPEHEKLSLSDPRLTVLRLPQPNGVDRDYDLAVRAATGEFCWLFTDDDLASPGLCGRILDTLEACQFAASVLLLDAVVREPSGEVLRTSMLPSGAPHRLEAGADAVEFAPLAGLLTFIGSVVIKRSLWLERSSERFVGTEFRHVGLVLERPLPEPVIIIREPLISIKYGAAHWEPRAVRVWLRQWPDLIDEVVSKNDRAKFLPTSPVRQALDALGYRARGLLGVHNVRDCYPRQRSFPVRSLFYLVAVFPRRAAAVVLIAKARVRGLETKMLRFDTSRGSRVFR